MGENKPMWGHFALPDVFADAFLDPVVRTRERPAPPFHLMASSIQLMTETLSRLARDRILDGGPPEMLKRIGILQVALTNSLQIGALLPSEWW